ncbi:ABC transporter permease [Endozoicomonas sp. SCSIO W0465]|uniref:ABC transporter permease n=1 Tax=Endozoicomonas sp. SCSIO W0465 TaxID=2918516 RepID=UPI003531CD7D
MRIWPQTLLPPAISMVLYFVIFGAVIGSRIGTMGGFSYMTYVLPGLVMMSVITNSFSNVASSFFSNKFQRSIEEVLISPVPDWIILAGYVLGGVARGVITGAIVMGLGLFFLGMENELEVHDVFATLLAVVMTATLFALGGFINGIFARKFDDVSIIPTFVLTPMTYLGGVFYSIDILPEFWQKVSMLNPILYQVNTFRYGLLGAAGGVDTGFSFVVMFLAILLLGAFSLHLLKTGRGLRS